MMKDREKVGADACEPAELSLAKAPLSADYPLTIISLFQPSDLQTSSVQHHPFQPEGPPPADWLKINSRAITIGWSDVTLQGC
jgi:hypothetical protein